MNNQELLAALEQAKAEIAELKTKTTATREIKGDKVRFETKGGKKVEGFGQLYYVVRFEGKLIYKEASTVEVLEKRIGVVAAE